MARSIQQLKQDLTTLEETVAKLAEELNSLYSKYLAQLGQSTKQQLVLASYQLCTHIYPESFLLLSLGERQKLQQSIRSIGEDIQSSLLEILENNEQLEEESSTNIVEEIIKNLPIGDEQKEEYELLDELEIPEEANKKELSSSEEAKEIINQLQNLSSELNQIDSQETANLNNPENLIRWQQKVEFNIKKSLESISRNTNKLLQDANVIPNRLPNKVLDIAIRADKGSSSNSRFNHLANILNLVVETEKDKQKKPTRAIQISLLRLRLSEIEFSDAILNSERTQIRNLLKKINQIKQQYRSKQQQHKKAEAEAAWRSSWYED